MTRGSPQTKQSRKTARRKSRQLRALVASILAAPRTVTRPTTSVIAATPTDPMAIVLASLGHATGRHGSLRRI